MARPRWTLALILIGIPILATVITAFRVRDLPKTANELRTDLKKQKCDDCDVNEPKAGQKLHSVKIESAKRSYEELKKAAREKIQAANQKEVKSSFKFKYISDEDDDDDGDDDDVNFTKDSGFKHQDQGSKSGKSLPGLKIEIKNKNTATFKSGDDDDNEDDNDDDDDDIDKANLVKLGKSSKESKSEVKVKESKKDTKPKFNLKISDDDDDDDDDDDNDDNDDEDDDNSDDNDDEDDDDEKISKMAIKKLVQSKPEPKIIQTKEKQEVKIKETQKSSLEDKVKEKSTDAKPKTNTKPDEIIKEKPATKDSVVLKKEIKADDKKKEDVQEVKKTIKQTKPEPIAEPLSPKKEEKKEPKPEVKKKEPPKKEELKPKTQEQKEAKITKEDLKKEKHHETETIKKEEKVVKPKVKEDKHDPERKKHSEKDVNKDKSSKESVDSREALPKSESHLKHVTDALHRRNLLLSEFEDFYAFFPTFAPNFSRIHNPECRRHGQIVLRQLRGTKLWAFSMLDATGKIPSGILQGNGIQLGDFDQCLASRARVQLESGSVVKVQGKYCLARLDVKAEHPDLELPVHLAQAKNLIKSRIDDPGHFVPRFSTLSWGVCVPNACEPQDVEVVIKDAVKHYQHTTGLVVRVKVDPSDCHEQEEGDWWKEWLELPTILTLSFYGVILLLVLVATLQDYFAGRKSEEETEGGETDDKGDDEKEAEEPVPQKKKDGFLISFSLYRTISKLVAPGTDDEIACIHGVRGLATLALLVAHKFLPVAVTPYTNRLKITETVSSPLWSWCRAGWVFTDCFLLLSGALMAHRVSGDNDTGAIRRLFSRYLRLTPALLAVVLFYAYVWDYISSGPMWGTLVTKNMEVCQEGWWWNLLYVQNYFGFEDMCAPQTHQLALDMQLTILGSILVWATQSELVGAKFLIPGIHVLAAYSRYSTVQEHRLTMLAYHGVSVSQLYRTARLSYTSTIHRSTPYLIGLSLGLILRKPSKHGKIMLTLGWLTSLSLWGLVWWAGFDSGSTQYKYNASFAAQYASFAPIASALAISWIIYIVHSGHCDWLLQLLCNRFLVLISRLSYALYLCQFIVFLTNAATVRSSTEFTLISLMDAQEISAILLSSTILTLTFVIPMQSLHKVFTFSSKTNEEAPEAIETSEENTEEKEDVQAPEEEPEEKEVIEAPPVRRQHLVAHREVLEEIPEVEVEFEMQRDKNDGLEEILEEEEGNEEEEERLDDDDLEIIEEEQEGGEDDLWEGREDYPHRRLYRRDDEDQDLDEWEWTTNGNGRSGAQYYRYSR